MKYMIIPVKTGATGIVTKGFKKLEAISRKTFNRFSTIGSYTSHKMILQSETGRLNGWDHRWFKRRSTVDRRLMKRQRNYNDNDDDNNNNIK